MAKKGEAARCACGGGGGDQNDSSLFFSLLLVSKKGTKLLIHSCSTHSPTARSGLALRRAPKTPSFNSFTTTAACNSCCKLAARVFFCISDVQHFWNASFLDVFLMQSANFQLQCANSQLQSAALTSPLSQLQSAAPLFQLQSAAPLFQLQSAAPLSQLQSALSQLQFALSQLYFALSQLYFALSQLSSGLDSCLNNAEHKSSTSVILRLPGTKYMKRVKRQS